MPPVVSGQWMVPVVVFLATVVSTFTCRNMDGVILDDVYVDITSSLMMMSIPMLILHYGGFNTRIMVSIRSMVLIMLVLAAITFNVELGSHCSVRDEGKDTDCGIRDHGDDVREALSTIGSWVHR